MMARRATIDPRGRKNSFQVSESPLSARRLDDAPLMGANNLVELQR
jgi:hypothetical protein